MRKKILILSVLLLAAVLLSGCAVKTAWPGLAATSEMAYLAHTNAVYAVNLNTGAKLWTFSGEKGGFLNSNPSLFFANPVVTEDRLVIVSDSGNKHVIYALDPNDVTDGVPHIKWKFSEAAGHWIASPLIVGNRLFAPNSDGKVYVLDLQDGQTEKKAIKVIKLSDSAEQTDRLWAQPVTDGKRLFVTSLDKRIFAINLETYEVLWNHQLEAAVPASPVIGADGMLYVGSLAKKLEKFDPATGDHESVLDAKNWIWSTPIVDGDNLYFSDIDGYLYSYNTASGKLNWDPIKLDGAITASPLILGDRFLVATESGTVYSVSADGESKVWYRPDTKKIGNAYTTPVLVNDRVLVAYLDSDYYLIALDQDGDLQWTFNGK